MANKYVDLSLSTSGGNGSSGAPWNASEFLNDAQAVLVDTDYLLCGQKDWEYTSARFANSSSNPNCSISFDAWDVVKYGPWRMKSGQSLFFGTNSYQTPTSKINGGIIEAGSLSFNGPVTSCYIKYYGSSFNANGFPFKGCTVQLVNNVGYFLNTFGSVFTDCQITGINTSKTIDGDARGTFNNCCFVDNTLKGTPVLNNCQFGLINANLPAWDAVRTAFSSIILSSGINIPPQPGTLPYSGYATGLWGTPRTGIGAMDFPTIPKVSSFSSPTVADGSTVTSTVDVSGTVSFLTAAFPTDTYFDSTSEVARVDVYYTHSEGRQNKRLVHLAPGFTTNASWSAHAKDGTWAKTKVRAFDWVGAHVNLDGTNIPSRENLTHASGTMTLNTY